MTPEEVYALTPKVCAMLRARGASHHLAEDVCADAIERILRRGAEPYTPAAVMTAAAWGLSRHWRDERPAADVDTVAVAVEGRDDEVERLLDARRMLSRVKLQPRQAEALRLRFAEDQSWGQIAVHIGCTEAEARLHGHNGLRRAREVLRRIAVD